MKNTHKASQAGPLRSSAGILSIVLITWLAASGCDDLLTEEPRSVAVETFYNTAEEVETAVNAIYLPYHTINYPDYIAVLDSHADWGYGRGSRAQYNDFQGLNTTNINRGVAYWNMFYLSIRDANLVISNAPNGKSISQADIDRYVAEAKFMRALGYFHLVKNWGGIPLRTEANMSLLALPKSSESEVYDLIVADLLVAEAVLPESQSQIGRPTRYAAKTMLADVYLHLGRYADARNKAAEVIQSGKYALVPIQTISDIQLKIFGPELLTSTEEIFYIKYARQPGLGNYMLWVLNHPNTKLYNFGGAYAHYTVKTDPFFKNWNDADLRKQLFDNINFGLGPNTMVSKKYIDQNAATGHNAGNDMPIYRYAEVLLFYAEAAARAAGAPTPEAIEALNKVHRRAYGKNPAAPSEVDFQPGDFNSLDSFIDTVLMEHAYEFIFEGKRWHVLKRTGTAAERILENRGIQIAEKHYLWPIPLGELNFNDALDPATDQNPGY